MKFIVEILRRLTGVPLVLCSWGLFVWQVFAGVASAVYARTPWLGQSRLGAVAQHTISEAIRMKLALVFFALIGICVVGLPFSIRGDSSLTGAVQSYLSYSLTVVGLLLSILSIVLSRSISDELVGKQIMLLLSKPLARWQYILGKWVGITILNLSFLSFSGAVIYGMVHYIRLTHPPLDDIYQTQTVAGADDPQAFSIDRQRLETEVLTARHSRKAILPDFNIPAEREFQERLRTGFYDNAQTFDREQERRRLFDKYMVRWRVVRPMQSRVFMFDGILTDRSSDNEIQIRYFPDLSGFPADEILRAEWVIGDRNKGAAEYIAKTRHVNQRFQTIKVPADCLSSDHTLMVRFINRNPFSDPQYYEIPEPLYPCTISFRTSYPVECYFIVGSFEGNFLRLLALMMCKLMLLTSVGLLMTSVFSYPVACLVSFMVFALAGLRSFLFDAMDQVSADALTVLSAAQVLASHVLGGEWGSVSAALQEVVVQLIGEMLRVLFFLIPDFGYYDGLETLVDGRNVGLVWVLQGVGELVLMQTTIIMGLAMILFHRREAAEVSV